MLHKELGEAHPVSSYCTSALGLARHKRGDLQAAETLYSDALAHQVRSQPSALRYLQAWLVLMACVMDGQEEEAGVGAGPELSKSRLEALRRGEVHVQFAAA